ncbi:unnamed protein product [Urochloa humidicola]
MAASLRLSALAVAAAVDQAGRVGAEEKVRNAICTALVTSAPPNPAVRDERAAVMRLAVESPCFYSAFILRAAGIRKEVSNFLVEVLPELTAPSLLLPRAPVPYGTRAHHLALWDTELQAPRLPEASSHGVRSRALFVPGFTASSTYPRSRFLGARRGSLCWSPTTWSAPSSSPGSAPNPRSRPHSSSRCWHPCYAGARSLMARPAASSRGSPRPFPGRAG